MAIGYGRVSVMRRGSVITARNHQLQVGYDLLTGLWNYSDANGNETIRGVCARWKQSDGKLRSTSDPCHRSFQAEPVQSPSFGEGTRLIFAHRASNEGLTTDVLLDLYSDTPFAVVSLRITNEREQTLAVERLELVDVPVKDGAAVGGIFLGSNPSDCLMFLNAGGLLAHGVRKIRDGLIFPPNDSDEYISDGMIFDPKTQRSVVFGFLDRDLWWSGAQVGYKSSTEEERAQQAITTWSVHQNCDGARCAAKSFLESERLYVNISQPAADAQQHYAATVGSLSNFAPVYEPPSATIFIRPEEGGTSAAQRIASLLTWNGLRGGDFPVGQGGIAHVRLDLNSAGDGNVASQFPLGVREMVAAVHNQGLGIGLDVYPFFADGDLDSQYRHALLSERTNQPAIFTTDGTVQGRVLDPTHPQTRDVLKAKFDRIVREWGFDTLYASLMPFRSLNGDELTRFRWHKRGLTRMQLVRCAYELLVEVKNEVAPDIRLGILDSVQGLTLSNEHGNSAGLDNYYRHRNPRWDGAWGIRDLLSAYAARWYTQGNWWNMGLGPLRFVQGRTQNEAQVLLTLGMLSGGNLTFSDDFSALDAEEGTLLASCFPFLGTMARPVPVADAQNTYAWTQTVETPHDSWELLALLNVSDTFDEVTIQFGDLGLSRSKSYVAYEFWDQMFMGTYQRSFAIPTLPPRCAKLFAIREEREMPTFLAGDLHVSQGKVELLTLGWDDKSETLLGVCQGPKNRRGTLYFYVPENYLPISAGCVGAKYSYHWRSPIYELHVALGETPVPFSIRFARASG